MDMPGEGLLTKMWETLTDKGIGSLLRPWQMRRDGKVRIELQVREKIALAEADRVAEQVRAGTLLVVGSALDSGPVKLAAPVVEPVGIAPPVTAEVIGSIQGSLIKDLVRREVNVAKAIVHAEEELATCSAPVPDSEIDADWLYKWRDAASETSNASLQFAWGQLLAGELRSPGKYPLRLLDLLKSLDRDDAKQIELVLPFAISDFLFAPEGLLDKYGINLNVLLHLQSLGILSGVSALVLHKNVEAQNNADERAFMSHGRTLAVKVPLNVRIDIPIVQVTTLGVHLQSLARFRANEQYLLELAEFFKSFKCSVDVCDGEIAQDGTVRVRNRRAV